MKKFIFCIVLLCGELCAQETQIQYLSGTDKDNTVDWEFFIDHGRNSGQWTTIPVPSNWELQGFGVYNYGRGDNPESDETAQYRYQFTTPGAWKGSTVNIVFEGVMTDTEVRINGKSAGEVHRGSFYRFKYDISGLLNYGSANTLEVTVKNWSANASVNSAERASDYWVFGGIYRPVYLEAKPKEHMDWTAIDARADGSFLMEVHLKNIRKAKLVTAQIQTLDGRSVGASFSAPVPKRGSKATLTSRVDDPLLWSSEFPNRYQVRVSLKEGDNVIHTVTEKFGFRTVELRPRDGFYINGRKILFKGVNRHSFWPESGRTTSRELSIMDVKLMKEMNMNAVRMSHYPPDKHFLEVCDSLGLYVLDELAGWQTYYDTEIARKLVKATVTRDVNHPSVVIWDNGNEGGNNPEVDDDFHLYDPQKRPLIHPWEIFRNTDTKHYKPYDCCVGSLFHGKEVFFPTEFLHGLYDGGHGAGLEDYWNLMRQNPLSAGGFLWVFCDEGVVRTDRDGVIDTWKNNAPDGILGPYREKEGSFYAIREIWSPVYMEDRKLLKGPRVSIPVENRFHFTDLEQCGFEWQMIQFAKPGKSGKSHSVQALGRLQSPAIPPGDDGVLNFDLPQGWERSDALLLSVTDPHGKEVYTYTFPLKSQRIISERILPQSEQKAEADEGDDLIEISAAGVQVSINKQTGLIESVRNARGPLSFHGGPKMDSLLDQAAIKEIKHYVQGNDYVVEVIYAGEEERRQPIVRKTLKYVMLGSGWLKVEYSYLPRQGYYDYLGVHFNYPEEKVRSVKWLGRGPYRVWKNRMRGVQLGVWEKQYNNTITGETLWEYPEFKGYHDQLYWAVIDNTEYPITIVTETEDIFLRLFTPDPPQGAYNDHTAGVFPNGDISFMHAISPIGTKFLKADRLGPQGQKNMFFYNRNWKPLSGTLYFNFGAGLTGN